MVSTRTGNRSVNAAVLGAALHPRRLRQRDVRRDRRRHPARLRGRPPPHIVHVLIGLALLGASRGTGTARRLNLLVASTYVALGVIGWSTQDTAVDVVALDEPDHLLHLVSGALLVAVALGADTRPASASGRNAVFTAV